MSLVDLVSSFEQYQTIFIFNVNYIFSDANDQGLYVLDQRKDYDNFIFLPKEYYHFISLRKEPEKRMPKIGSNAFLMMQNFIL